MLTKAQKAAERDLPVLRNEVVDAEKALKKAQEQFGGDAGDIDLTKVDSSSAEFKALMQAGTDLDTRKQQLQDALSVVRYFDHDANVDILPERGKGVGSEHSVLRDRGAKAAIDRFVRNVDAILPDRKGGLDVDQLADDDESTYAKAIRPYVQATDRDEVKARAIGHLLDRDGVKTLITRGQGGLDNLVRAERLGLVDSSPFESFQLLDFVPVGTTGSNSIEYPVFLGRTGAAALIPDPTGNTVGSATTKPDIGFTFGIVSERARTIAAGIPVHRNSLEDIPYIRSVVEEQLPLAIRALLQAQIIRGDGTGENFLGAINRSGITTVARNAAGSEANVDAIHRTLTQMRLVGDEPQTIGLSPLTWEGMRLAKNVQGDYYYGAPAIAGAPTLWGKPVVTDVNILTTEALCVDWRKTLLLVRSALTLRSTDSHNGMFMQNLIQFLCEGRWNFKAERPSAIGRTTALN